MRDGLHGRAFPRPKVVDRARRKVREKVRIRLRREARLRPLPDCLTRVATARLLSRTYEAHSASHRSRSFRSPSAAARTDRGATSPPRTARQVTVAHVIERDVTEWDEFTGRLEAVDTVDVRPRVSGYRRVRFHEGAIVRRGDLLFQIDPRPFQAEVDRLRAELHARAPRCSAPTPSSRRAERLRAENAIAHEEHDRRASVRAGIDGAGRPPSRPRCGPRS